MHTFSWKTQQKMFRKRSTSIARYTSTPQSWNKWIMVQMTYTGTSVHTHTRLKKIHSWPRRVFTLVLLRTSSMLVQHGYLYKFFFQRIHHRCDGARVRDACVVMVSETWEHFNLAHVDAPRYYIWYIKARPNKTWGYLRHDATVSFSEYQHDLCIFDQELPSPRQSSHP